MKKSKIPVFKSYEEEAKFWDTHSFTEFMDELKPATLHFPRPKHLLVTLKPKQLQAIREIAARQDTPYPSLIQRWISDRLKEESVALAH